MPKDIRIRHVRSEWYRSAIIDSGTSTIVGDPFGAQINLTLGRFDSQSQSEMIRVEDNGTMGTVANAIPEAETVRLLEFTAVMRPNQAKTLVIAIQNALRALTPEVRAQYGITDNDLGVSP
jgi:hypothetical protein